MWPLNRKHFQNPSLEVKVPTAALPAPCAGSYLRTARLPRTDVKFCLASLYRQCALEALLVHHAVCVIQLWPFTAALWRRLPH
jgi:hypothetical protein